MIWSLRYWIDAYQTSKKLPLRTNYLGKSAVRQKTDFLLTDIFNVKGKHGINDASLINLAGGIPTLDFENAHCHGYSVNESVYKIETTYDFGPAAQLGRNLYGRVIRTIDFEKRQIYNDEVQLQKKGTGFATNLFINQLNKARRRGFLTLKMQGAGGSDYPADSIWEGYKVWAKYGYVMSDYYQKKYDDWRSGLGLKQKTLNDLYWSKHYGLWERTGFSWDGVFDLRDGSKSLIYLKRYLAAKRLNVQLSRFESS